MIDIRVETQTALEGHSGIVEIVKDKIFQTSSLDELPVQEEVFIVHRLGLQRPRNVRPASTGTIQVWAYDMPGDYSRIDLLLTYARQALEGIQPRDELLAVDYLETSVDLYDDSWGRITRNIRFQHTLSGRM